jgi:hypothetical protein
MSSTIASFDRIYSLASQTNDEDSNIDIFKLIVNAHELTKELVNM